MSDIVERLRAGEPCSIEGGDRCKVLDAASGCLCATAADTITALRSALLDAEKESKYSFFEAHLDQMGDANRHLRAEVERLGRDYQTARDAHDKLMVENERLRDEVRVWVAHTKMAVWSDTEECKFLNEEITRLVKSRNRWAHKYNDLLAKRRAEDGYDVYAAAREEYRKKITEQAAENAKLRAALDEAQQAFALESYNAKRLRAALEWIAETALTEPETMVAKARAALKEEGK